MATAELAVALPCLVVVLVVAWSALAAATDQVRCLDSAQATARLLARGDAPDSALAAGRRLAPLGALLKVSRTAAEVEVEVVGAAPPGLAWLGSRATPHAAAVAVREDSVGLSAEPQGP